MSEATKETLAILFFIIWMGLVIYGIVTGGRGPTKAEVLDGDTTRAELAAEKKLKK